MRLILLFALSLFSALYARENLHKVSLQLDWKYQFEFAGFIAAKEKGFYRDAGLDVELREYQDNTDTASDILNRKANYGSYNTSIIVSGKQPAPTVLLGTYYQRSPLVFVVRKDIRTPADLIGKRIMCTKDEFRSSSLGLMLNHFDINQNNAKFLSHTFKIHDFIDGKTDAMAVFRSNQLYELDRLHIPYNILDPYDYGFMMSAVNVFTSRSEALENPERTQRFIDATNRGWKYALDHPYEIIDLLLKKYSTEKSREALIYEYKVTKKMMMTDFYPIGQANEELTIRAYKQLVQSGRLLGDHPLGKFMFKDVVASAEGTQMTTAQKQYLLNKKEITMCVDPEWYPFEAIRKGHHIGIAADVMNEFERTLGIPIKLLNVTTWEESIEHAKKRECDIFSLASSTPQRLKYMNFTAPYIAVPIVMATKMDKLFTEDITTLGKKKLGVVKGYAIVEQLKSLYPDLNLVEVKSITNGLERVESGELYGYIDNLMVISSYIQKEHTGTLKVSSRLKEKLYLSVGTRNDDPMLHDIFEKLVSGTNPVMMQTIYNRYAAVVYENNRYFWLLFYLLGGVGIVSILVIFWNWLLQKRVKVQLNKNSEQEKQLFQKAKQAELGTLIASISHQWREPLSQISSINLLTLSRLRVGGELNTAELDLQCEKIEETIDFMSQTMQSFLEFYKVSTTEGEFNVYDSVQRILAIAETKLLQYDITVLLTGDQDVSIQGIKNEWMQIWLNLINNTVEAFKNKKTLHPVLKIQITDSAVSFCDNGGGVNFEETTNGLGHKMCEDITVKYGAQFHLENDSDGLCARIEFKKS